MSLFLGLLVAILLFASATGFAIALTHATWLILLLLLLILTATQLLLSRVQGQLQRENRTNIFLIPPKPSSQPASPPAPELQPLTYRGASYAGSGVPASASIEPEQQMAIAGKYRGVMWTSAIRMTSTPSRLLSLMKYRGSRITG